MGTTNLNEIFTLVDVSHEINHEKMSHTGGAMSMGMGVTTFRSSKQELNTTISTEEDLVGARN